jgi:hypothetical protein
LTPANQSRSDCCQTWESLTGVWATDPDYGSKILLLYGQMLAFALANSAVTGSPVTGSPVTGALSLGALSSAELPAGQGRARPNSVPASSVNQHR